MTVLGREVPKLPFVFAGIGTAYYLVTLARKPMTPDAAWDRHMSDARFGLYAGLGAGALLWWFEV